MLVQGIRLGIREYYRIMLTRGIVEEIFKVEIDRIEEERTKKASWKAITRR